MRLERRMHADRVDVVEDREPRVELAALVVELVPRRRPERVQQRARARAPTRRCRARGRGRTPGRPRSANWVMLRTGSSLLRELVESVLPVATPGAHLGRARRRSAGSTPRAGRARGRARRRVRPAACGRTEYADHRSDLHDRGRRRPGRRPRASCGGELGMPRLVGQVREPTCARAPTRARHLHRLADAEVGGMRAPPQGVEHEHLRSLQLRALGLGHFLHVRDDTPDPRCGSRTPAP